jgi:hypothetical protein
VADRNGQKPCAGQPWATIQAVSIAAAARKGQSSELADHGLELLKEAGVIRECPQHPGFWLIERRPEARRAALARLRRLQGNQD